MILIDPPMWPAHHTLFSHLISDTSLEQLHQFAALAGIPDGAFDGDHYDVPESRHGQLVDQGAVPVSAGELIRRLRASGLRMPARERPARVRRVLRHRWQHLAPQAAGLGEELLERWAEPHRRYHTPVHLLDVLTALETLCAPATPPLEVVLAAWFHDAVYEGVAGTDEQASADLARTSVTQARLAAPPVAAGARVGGAGPAQAAEPQPLPGGTESTPESTAAEVARLVLLTHTHAPAHGDTNGALLCDADLAVLGRSPSGYARYLRAVRAEYAHVSKTNWRKGRSAVVKHLLAQQPLFHTDAGRARWEESARANLEDELRDLRNPG